MNKYIEKIKDILYDSFEYVVIAGIVVIVALIIGWRLDILFANDIAEDVHNDSEIVVVGPKEAVEEPNNKPLEDDTTDEEVTGKNIDVVIPTGALPGEIAVLLKENGLVDDDKDFISKVVELNLDTKLKSGTYSIPEGSSYEEILNILTK